MTQFEAVASVVIYCRVTIHLNTEWFKGTTILFAHNSAGQQFELDLLVLPGVTHVHSSKGTDGFKRITVASLTCLKAERSTGPRVEQPSLGFFQGLAEFQDTRPQSAAFFEPLLESRLSLPEEVTVKPRVG